jgi:hypothetical protein
MASEHRFDRASGRRGVRHLLNTLFKNCGAKRGRPSGWLADRGFFNTLLKKFLGAIICCCWTRSKTQLLASTISAPRRNSAGAGMCCSTRSRPGRMNGRWRRKKRTTSRRFCRNTSHLGVRRHVAAFRRRDASRRTKRRRAGAVKKAKRGHVRALQEAKRRPAAALQGAICKRIEKITPGSRMRKVRCADSEIIR